MVNKRSSVTPKTDAETALFAKLYAEHEHIDCTMDQFRKARCKCGCKFSYVMSSYAFHRSAAEVFVTSECGRRIWLNRTDYYIMKEDHTT